ncbi:LIM domain-containing protein 1 isoform X2 [Mugil cephalus]|uniref:LIM domain-containing protein 1 isoform X2 n=1 Tax=Mugil cephalus TaxID=48193 RepID=UPI001FB715A0|nr:LIM domain-containing protein 1 isoform X2 [Mugil cephalus]
MEPSYSTTLYFGSCTRCSKAVHGGAGRGCRAMGCLYHNTCFTCSVCDKNLSGKTFYILSGLIYCEEDFLRVSSLRVFLQVLQARGKPYHPSCFRCVVCRRSLEGQPFAVDSDSRVYCVSDFHRVQAHRCAACKMPILPTEGSAEAIRVVSLNRNYHVECYNGEVNLT